MFYPTIIDKDVFYVTEEDLDATCDQEGWYVEWELSDGGYDIFGPFSSKEEARSNA
jgi:hypothetical protein